MDQVARSVSHFSFLSGRASGTALGGRLYTNSTPADHLISLGRAICHCLLVCKAGDKDPAITRHVLDAFFNDVGQIPLVPCAMAGKPSRERRLFVGCCNQIVKNAHFNPWPSFPSRSCWDWKIHV